MKKILIYFNSMRPAGGIERVIATLSDKLSAEFEITILVKDEPLSFYPLNKNIKIHSLQNALRFNMHSKISRMLTAIKTIISNSKSLRNYLKENDYDFYYLAHPLNVLEFNIAGARKSKIIITEHGARSAYNSVYRMIKKMIYNSCHAYIVPTKTDVKLYQGEGFPAVYIPHFRSNLLYSNSKRINRRVLNIGRFTSDKQQLSLLRIWKNIIFNRNFIDWKLQIVGSGELEHELYDFVQNNNLDNYVEFLAPSKSVEGFYNNASIFALTSSSEGFGMVLLEAISFGLPCVSFDCPSGPRDIIEDDLNGFLIPLNNDEVFENKLLTLMRDNELTNRMGDQAFESSQGWADATILDRWLKVLK